MAFSPSVFFSFAASTNIDARHFIESSSKAELKSSEKHKMIFFHFYRNQRSKYADSSPPDITHWGLFVSVSIHILIRETKNASSMSLQECSNGFMSEKHFLRISYHSATILSHNKSAVFKVFLFHSFFVKLYMERDWEFVITILTYSLFPPPPPLAVVYRGQFGVARLPSPPSTPRGFSSCCFVNLSSTSN